MGYLLYAVFGLVLVALSSCAEEAKDKAVNKRSLNHGVNWDGASSLHGGYGRGLYYSGSLSDEGVNTHTHSHTVHTITKEVPRPYPVTVTKEVPVSVPQPYPVHIPVEKRVAVPVPIKVPVEVPRPYPVTVTREVEKPVYVKIHEPVPVPQPYPVTHTVEVPTPVYIKESSGVLGSSLYSGNHGYGNGYGYGSAGSHGALKGIYVPSHEGGLNGIRKGSGWQKNYQW